MSSNLTTTDIALKFINDYADLCSKNPSGTKDWINKNNLLTDNFKFAYKNILDSAYMADPEMGLDFDPIFDAQDYPDKGFELVSFDEKTGLIKVKGKGWTDFLLVLKVVNHDKKWLVDGSGVINIPESHRAKR